MPELPEVQTIVTALARRLVGRTIREVLVLKAEMLRKQALTFAGHLNGRRIKAVERHGKSIFVEFETESERSSRLRIHLGMTGQILFLSPGDPPAKHTHVILKFDDPSLAVHYRDIRRFGRLEVIEASSFSPVPDAWRASKEVLYARLRSKRGMVKHALLNQHVVAGLGNIYVDESLYRSKIHPKQDLADLSSERLHALCLAIHDVLAESIELGGTSFRNYVDTAGGRGGFKGRLQVYGKEGSICSCGARIRKIVAAGRGTHFCPRCQRLRRTTRKRGVLGSPTSARSLTRK